MCKNKNIKVGIKELHFSKIRGKMAVYLIDGREIIVPVSFFLEISKLPLAKRKDWMVLDDQFFTFAGLSKIYSISEIM